MSQETPVLKNKLNNWLRHSPRVLAFASAPRQFGGAGAVQVLIKRKKIIHHQRSLIHYFNFFSLKIKYSSEYFERFLNLSAHHLIL